MQTIGNRKLCDLCFAELDLGAPRCPYCDGLKNTARFPTSLAEGTILARRYCVGRVLGKGGFGITYLCYDMVEHKKVAVKEYLPDTLSHRDTGKTIVSTYGGDKSLKFQEGASRFFEEASLVSRFNGNPCIIGVYEFFNENNTTYFVMEYLSGMDMKKYMYKYGKRPEGEILYIADQVTKALAEVHGMATLHRDIAPDNIFICDDGSVKLIDFGAARQVVANQSNSLSVIVKNGFAPMEQYQRKGKQGPWTDIYALGATLYYGLTGKMAEDAPSRLDSPDIDFSGVSPEFARIIEKMMAVNSYERYQSVAELRADLAMLPIAPLPLMVRPAAPTPEVRERAVSRELPVVPSSRVSSSVSSAAEKPAEPKKKKWVLPVAFAGGGLLLAGIAGLLVIGVGILFLIGIGDNKDDNVTNQVEDVWAESVPDTDSVVTPNVKPEINTDNPTVIFPNTTTPSDGEVGWYFENGTLTIYGKGPMEDYSMEVDPEWFSYTGQIQHIEIMEGITSIGDYAFCVITQPVTVSIPSTVTSIGDSAFMGCDGLTSITIPNSVKTIKESAFYGCEGLTSVVIPPSVTLVDYFAFASCTNLRTALIQNTEGAVSVSAEAFYDCPVTVTYMY